MFKEYKAQELVMIAGHCVVLFKPEKGKKRCSGIYVGKITVNPKIEEVDNLVILKA